MPQNEAFENHNLLMKTAEGASHSCYRVVANLMQFMAGRQKGLGGVNERLDVVPLPSPMPFLEPPPTPADNRISGTVH
jgi:hypothetical protein